MACHCLARHLVLLLWGACLVSFSWSTNPAVNGAKRNVTNCYVSDADEAQHWVLKWEEHFDDDLSQWEVQQEGKYCSGNNVQAESCNVKENAFTLNGNLVLIAKHANHYSRHYTGARVSSPFLFPQYYTGDNIRFEVRAAFPVGQQIYASLFAANLNETTFAWDKYVWFELATNAQRSALQHGAHEVRPSHYGPEADYDSTDLNQFHVYSIEWNGTYVNLNLNGKLTKAVKLYMRSDPVDFQVIFVIGVGGKHFSQPLPLDFNQLNWHCPALIIDYVRAYEKIQDPEEYPKCAFQESPNSVIDGICALALEHSHATAADDEDHTVGSEVGLALIIFVATLLGLSLLLIAYFFIRSGKLTARMRATTYQRNTEDFLFEYNRNGESSINGAFDSRN